MRAWKGGSGGGSWGKDDSGGGSWGGSSWGASGGNSWGKDKRGGNASWGDSGDWKAKRSRSDGSGGNWDWDGGGKGDGDRVSPGNKDALDADLDAYFGKSGKDKGKEALDSQLESYFGKKDEGDDTVSGDNTGVGEAPAATATTYTEGSKEALDDQLEGYFSKKGEEEGAEPEKGGADEGAAEAANGKVTDDGVATEKSTAEASGDGSGSVKEAAAAPTTEEVAPAAEAQAEPTASVEK